MSNQHQGNGPFNTGRRRFLAGMSGLAAGWALGGPFAAAAACPVSSPVWQQFVRDHVQPDGRVVDFVNKDLRSTSESQSYALFFALVDNDPVLFERVLAWTRHNLSHGRPDLHLPAWLWGQDDQGHWRILDANTASDGELWIAYALLEADRLWHRPGYREAALRILALIRREEVVDLPGLGPMLLPGKQGFAHADRWTLNPSYLPLFVLRRLAAADPAGPWAAIARNSARMMRESSPKGFAPDWVAWDGQRFSVDPAKGVVGSYDAIRCYLWAGMTASDDPLRKDWLNALQGPVQMLLRQPHMAERVDTRTGGGSGVAPAGFSAALLPYLAVNNRPALLSAQLARIQSVTAPLPYYERMLLLFGHGWHSRRFRFSTDGRLMPAWSSACSASI